MFMAMVLGTVVFWGCDPKVDPTPDPGPDDKPALQSFEVSVDAVTKTSVTYTVTPAVLDKEYVAVVKMAESLEGLEDEDIVEAVFADIKAAAGAEGLTFAEKMPKVVSKGVSDKVEIDGLAVGTEYALVVFGVDPEKEWAYTTFPEVKEFKTEEVEVVNYTFEVTTEVENNTVRFNVVPSHADINWHLTTVTKEMFDGYTDPNGDYGWTKEEFYQAYTSYELESYLGAGYSEEETLAAMFPKGQQELYAEGLDANTEYVYLIAAFQLEDTTLYIASEVSEGTYTTGDVVKTELTFDITVTDIEQQRAAVCITPSDLEARFCWMCAAYDGVSSAEEVMNGIVTSYGMWMDYMTYTGVQDYTGGPNSPYKYALDFPDTDYYVIAFGYAGGITSDPVMVTFRTLPGGDPADCTFEYEVTETSTYGISFNVTPSDNTVYYSCGLCPVGEYDEAVAVAETEAGIEEMFQMMQMWDPNTTIGSIVSTYYWKGANVMDSENLSPDTEYTMYILALDTKTGKVAKAHEFPAIARTKSVGTVVPEIELVGYFSGDDEAGAIWGQPDITAGKCIAVVKYNVDPSATALYNGVLEGNGMDMTEYPDATIMEYLRYYWEGVSLEQPYTFFLSSWQAEQTVFAYALDADGGMGSISRFLLNPTAEEKGNIEDLIALVNELNSQATSTAAVASVADVEVSRKPVVTAREKAEVVTEMPAEHVVPFKAKRTIRTGNLMMLDFVPAYWIR